MNATLFLPVLLIAVGVFAWNAFPRRIAQDVAEWEITPQEARGYVFMYRGWSVALVVTGVVMALLTFAGK